MQTTLKSTAHLDTLLSLRPEWVRCSRWIQDALEYAHGSHTLEDVYDAVVRGDAQFWPAEDVGLVTEIVEYPQRRTLRFWLAGGNLETLEWLEAEIIEWSKPWGCKACEIVGRRGWVKALEGYQDVATVGVKVYG